jgi:hypothetical protein
MLFRSAILEMGFWTYGSASDIVALKELHEFFTVEF